MIEIKLENNRGHILFSNENISVKGYFTSSDDMFYHGDEMLAFLNDIRSSDDFLSRIKNINGVFTILLKVGDRLFIATDTTRVFPIFYTIIENKLFVSDSVEYLISIKSDSTINELASKEFISSGYVLGSKTLIDGINQIISDEYIIFSNIKIIDRGFRFSYSAGIKDLYIKDYEVLFKETGDVFERSFKRLIKSIEGKQVVLPLSGGYDSRLIAVMLKKYGVDDVICFTYGKIGNFELSNSERTAKVLGFKWVFIEYNDSLIEGYLGSEEFKEYSKYSGKFSSMPFLQEYFSIQYLKDNDL